VTPFLARQERLGRVASTQDIVRAWLAEGVPEVCLAAADEQTAGRGRIGRSWIAPAGAAILLSVGFRPTWLPPERAWRLAATVSLAMADAAEDGVGLRVGAIRLKWPNDLVVEAGPAKPPSDEPGRAEPEAFGSEVPGVAIRKLGGVLGETDGLGTPDPRVIVGIGINADWAAADFPSDLARAMTSLREAARGRPIDGPALLAGFVDRLEARIEALRGGYFDIATWVGRQVTTGRLVRIEGHAAAPEEVRAIGVDGDTGALVIEGPDGAERSIHAGEVTRIRLAGAGIGSAGDPGPGRL
jgi:BirA family transcriptional regulator, biotin operon repressor / biotin---[acetyl-CoA-carboxylase] ligase